MGLWESQCRKCGGWGWTSTWNGPRFHHDTCVPTIAWFVEHTWLCLGEIAKEAYIARAVARLVLEFPGMHAHFALRRGDSIYANAPMDMARSLPTRIDGVRIERQGTYMRSPDHGVTESIPSDDDGPSVFDEPLVIGEAVQ